VDLTDRVEQISALIADLREAAGDGRKSRAVIDSLFRAVHSFKAAASAEGREDITSAAHQFESVLQALRTGELALDAYALELCEQSAAGLLDGAVISSFDHFTITEINKVQSHPLLPDEFASLRDEERNRAAAAMQEGSNLYVMKVTFDASDFDERFRRLEERVKDVADLISTAASMDDDKIIFEVVYASDSEKIPSQTVVDQAILAGKAVAAELGKEIQFVVKGEDLLLDTPLAEALTDVLLHLVRNAVDHGIETHGTVLIEVSEQEVCVTDDGRGIAPENLAMIFQPGFSTTKEVTQLSGRGVGLDVVKTLIENLGGSVTVSSQPGKTSFKIRMPNPSLDA
jgi:chemotaxis protein histidine kinase CheA